MNIAVILFIVITHLVILFGFILLERRSPSATLIWVLVLIFLPGIGIILYLLLGNTQMTRIKKKSAKVALRLKEILQKYDLLKKLTSAEKYEKVCERTRDLVKLTHSLTSLPATLGNRCEILYDAASTYQQMMASMDTAQHHIHVEFYIFRSDETGKSFRQMLIKKAQQNIEVRVIYDAVGSSALPKSFWMPLIKEGGEVARFKPLYFPFKRRDRIDFRNHRKIVIVDGSVGFTGGINVGREYLGLNPEIGSWRDCHIKIKGPAVLGLQQTFAEDWLFTTSILLEDAEYYPLSETQGDAIVDIVDSGPDRQWAAIQYVYFQAIALARERVWIASPYFVPNSIIKEALVTAALRGVDVRILLPAHTDSYLVQLASRSYYQRLLEAGVRIYEYQKGFLHAKTMVVDQWMGTIGSANMDIRSFKLNFELNAFVYEKHFVEDLAKEFKNDLNSATEVTFKALSQRNYFQKLAISGARLFSPLL